MNHPNQTFVNQPTKIKVTSHYLASLTDFCLILPSISMYSEIVYEYLMQSFEIVQ